MCEEEGIAEIGGDSRGLEQPQGAGSCRLSGEGSGSPNLLFDSPVDTAGWPGNEVGSLRAGASLGESAGSDSGQSCNPRSRKLAPGPRNPTRELTGWGPG